MNGHWFCSGKCNDVVNMSAPCGRWDIRHGVKCPVCHQHTADWIHDAAEHVAVTQPPRISRVVNPATAARLFAQMKEAIR